MAKRSIKETALWLQYRDKWIAKQPQPLTCFYCKLKLVSDAPVKPKTLTSYLFSRKKGLPEKLIATVDHKTPTSKGAEKFDESNFAVCCKRCNNKKADRTAEEFQLATGKLSKPA